MTFNPYQNEYDEAMQVYEEIHDKNACIVVDDEQEVTKYIRTINHLDGEYNAVLASKKAEMERLALYYDAELSKLEERRKFFEVLVTGYYKRQREQNPNYKLKTPWGKVSQRKTKSASWENEAETLQWLKETKRTDLIKTEESIKKADLKKAFIVADCSYIDEATGEVVPGVTIEEKTSIKVTTEGGKDGQS